MRDVRALAALTHILALRLLREGMVRRSLLWPTALTAGTLIGTLVVFASLEGHVAVGVLPGLPEEITAELEARGYELELVADPEAAVRDGLWAALDPPTLWTNDRGARALELESATRELMGASWRPTARTPLPRVRESGTNGTLVCRLVATLFALYGVVFGLGMVARDREDGTLAAELSLPIARWVPGAARWTAGWVLLSIFYALCVGTFDALMGLSDPGATTRHGAAACGAATALGVALVGRAGLRQSFAGPFAMGMTAATGLITLGATSPSIGQWLPLASVYSEGSGWVPLALTLVCGGLAALGFSLRAARE